MKHHTRISLKLLSAALCLAGFLANDAKAVLSYWDPEGNLGSYNTYTGTGGTVTPPVPGTLAGTWETMSWSRNATGGSGAPADQGQTSPQAFTELDAAVFAVGAGATNSGNGASTTTFTVTLTSDHTVAGFFDGPLNPHSCIVTLVGPGRVILPVANPGNALDVSASSDSSVGWMIFSNTFTGGGNLIAEGSGQAFLRGTNDFTGGIQTGYTGAGWSGIVNFNNPYAFGTGPIKISRGYSGSAGALVVETDGVTITNTVDWSGALSNAPYQNIVGSQPAGLTFSGPWNLGSKAVNVGSGGSGLLFTISGPITGTGSFAKYNASTLQLSRANTYSGATTVTAGTLQQGVANAIPFGAGKGAVTVGVTGTTPLGTLDLNGLNAQINSLAGPGVVDDVSAGGTPTLTISNSTGTTTFTGTIQNTSGTLSFVKNGASTEVLDGPNTWSGSTTIGAGTLQVGNADANGQLGNTGTVTDNGTLAFKRTDVPLTINNLITGSGNVSQLGSGMLILNNANTYAGSTTISGGGTLQLAAANNVPATSYINVVSNLVGGITPTVSVFDLNNISPLTYAYLSGAGNVINSSGTLTINGNNLTVGSSPNTYSCFSGVLSGSANLTKDGTSAMALRGQNTFSGGTVSVLNGTLSVGAAPDRVPNTSAVSVAGGARFQLDASSQTIASLTGAGAVNIQGGTLTVTPSGPDTFVGVIQNSDVPGSSTATGNGLRGYYYGNEDLTILKAVRDDATVNFTNLAITNDVTALPNAGIAITNFSIRWLGQVLTTATPGTYLFGMDSDDGARIWVNGTLVLDQWVTQSHALHSGLIDLAANTRYDIVVEYLQQTGGAQAVLEWAQVGTSTTNVIPNANLFLPSAGTLVMGGSGTLGLSSVSTFTGSTMVNSGTLDVLTTGRLPSRTVTVADGATLKLDSATALSSAASLLLNASSAVILNYSGAAFAGSLSLDGGSTFVPSGLWGAPGSGAPNTDARFSGSGLLNVMPCSQTNALLSIVHGVGNSYTLNFHGSTGATYYVLSQTNVAQPQINWTVVPGSTNTVSAPSGLWSVTVTNPAPAFYRAKAIDLCQ